MQEPCVFKPRIVAAQICTVRMGSLHILTNLR